MMIAVILPIVFIALIGIVTLGVSFFCFEAVLRLIGRGLSGAAVPAVATTTARHRAAAGAMARRGNTGRLQSLPAQ